MRKKYPWFEIALSIVFLSAYVYAAFSDAYNLPNRWFIRDDAYYYFKVAQNISEGHGSTFDGIHPTNGYHPLWMLICVPIFALARYDVILPLRVLVLVTGVLQIATAILLYRLIRSAVSPPAAMLAAAYWVFSTYILLFLYKTGVESSIGLFFIVLLIYLTHKFEQTWRTTAPSAGRVSLLAAVAALAVFSRLDLIFFALIMGIWIVLRNSPMRYLLPLDLLAVFISTIGAFIARLGLPAYYDGAGAALIMAILALVIKIPTFYLLGLYRRSSNQNLPAFLARIAAAVLISSAVLSAVLLLGSFAQLLPGVSRTILLFDVAITLGLILLIRAGAYLFGSRRGSEGSTSPLQELRSKGMTWLREGATYYGIVGGSLALYMLWNRLAFGSFSPVSGEVKRWWGTFIVSVYGGPAKSWLAFFTLDPYSEFNAWQPISNRLRDWSNRLLYHEGSKFGNPAWQQNFVVILLVALALVLLILLVMRKKATRSAVQASMIPLFVGSWFQSLSYNVTGYASPKEWYWLTEPVLLIILGAVLMNVLFEVVLKKWAVTRILIWAIVAAYAIPAGLSYWRDAYELNPYGHTPAKTPYAEVVPFLEAHTRPGDVIGMTGGGNVGYFIHDRTIVNMDGLINSTDYFKDLKAGTSSNYLYDTGMRYVFANPNLLNANPYRGQFVGRLNGIASWGGKDLMKLLPDASE